MFRQGDLAGAARLLEAALQSAPEDVATLHLLARCLRELNRLDEALAAFDKAAALKPDSLDILLHRGMTLRSLQRLDEALASFEMARTLTPNHPDVFTELGLTLASQGRLPEAIEMYNRAMALTTQADAVSPSSLRYVRGMAHFMGHDLAQAWPDYEERWAAGMVNSAPQDRGEPIWRGERVNGVLRIWPEQGIGDEILFARFALLARERADRLVLECAPRLVPLFARSFPDIEVCAVGEAPAAAAQISTASLGLVLHVDRESLRGGPYLKADPQRTAQLRMRYEAMARGRPIVGISWRSTVPRSGRFKSASLESWAPLLRKPFFLVSLQYGDVSADIAKARAFGCEIFSDPDIDQMADLDAFAAQVAAMAQVVSVSNTAVHFAGALGKPTIVLPPPARGRLWYWGVEGKTTPWYDSVRIVRREVGADWESQIAKAAAELP